jgi:hypothetical protein
MTAWTLGYAYDPNDFAVEVVEYVEGTGIPKDSLTGHSLIIPRRQSDGRRWILWGWKSRPLWAERSRAAGLSFMASTETVSMVMADI